MRQSQQSRLVFSAAEMFKKILNLPVILGNSLQQMTSADNIFRCIFFLGALRVKKNQKKYGPQRNIICLRGFRQSETQTSLLSYRDYLEN